MPLNVRRFCTSVLLVLFTFIISANAQSAAETPQSAAETRTPTAGEIMRERISKAKANIAVRNYNAALYELETISRETSDPAVNAVVDGLLMNTYIDQGDYKRAEDFLRRSFDSYRSNNAHSDLFYSAVAGQVVKGSRNKVDRYRAFGLMVSDRNLPLEAVADLEQMRELLELLITQTKELSEDDKKANVAVPLLEVATNSRSALARDDYDAKRWRDQMADSREIMASSRGTIFDVLNPPAAAEPAPETTVASNTTTTRVAEPITETADAPAEKKAAIIPAVRETPAENRTEAETETTPKNTASDKAPPARPRRIINNNAEKQNPPVEKASEENIAENTADDPASEPAQQVAAEETGPVDVGQLIGYAIEQARPVYPANARAMRTSGLVRVEVIVDTNGDVEEVRSTEGPMLLQNAARNAALKWKFRPFTRNGQPVKATGFINFNFSL